MSIGQADNLMLLLSAFLVWLAGLEHFQAKRQGWTWSPSKPSVGQEWSALPSTHADHQEADYFAQYENYERL
jgi:hypothetical protein